MDFRSYCVQKGIDILRTDLIYIRDKLSSLPRKDWLEVRLMYIEKWLEGMNEEQSTIRKQNKGRFRANQFLREYYEREKNLLRNNKSA